MFLYFYFFSSVLNNHDLPLKLLAKAPRARHKHLLTAYLACSILLDLPQAPFIINLARSVSLDLPQAPFSINLARSISLNLPQAPFSINLACSMLLDLPQAPFFINLARSMLLDLPQAPFSINLARSVCLDLPQAPFSINLARGDRLYGEQERPCQTIDHPRSFFNMSYSTRTFLEIRFVSSLYFFLSTMANRHRSSTPKSKMESAL